MSIEMVGWHHQLNGHEFEQTPGDSERQGSLVCCSPWGHKKSYTTWRLNNNNNPPLPPHLQPPPCGQTCPEARGQESYQCSHLPGHWSRGAPRNGRENRRIRRQCALGVSPHLGQRNSCRVPQNGILNMWNRYVLRRLWEGEKGDLVLTTDWVKIMNRSEPWVY